MEFSNVSRVTSSLCSSLGLAFGNNIANDQMTMVDSRSSGLSGEVLTDERNSMDLAMEEWKSRLRRCYGYVRTAPHLL
jgi:hypothetical protein